MIVLIGASAAVFVVYQQTSVSSLINIAGTKYRDFDATGALTYRPYVGIFSLGGRLSLELTRQEDLRAVVKIEPPGFLKKLSKGQWNLHLTSSLDPASDLPLTFERTTDAGIRKNKSAEIITYHHDKLFMQRREATEDILADTRDPVSVLVWLMHRNYEKERLIKTTMNIHRTIYMVVGKAQEYPDKNTGSLVKVKLRLVKTLPTWQPLKAYTAEVILLKRKDFYLPLRWDLDLGFFRLRFSLN